jgi:hypothetical protein
MAAGLGFMTFTTGEVLTAGDVNGYLMQGVLVFASAAARNAAITSPQEGQFAFTKDTNGLWYYDGAAWVASGATGDIEGVTAGVGITGGGTSGTVTITNDMATTITASGDIVVGTGSGTYDNLPIGTTGQVLTADTTVSPYKVKWASAGTTAVTCVLTKSASQTISGSTNTAVTWNTELIDTDAFHSTVTNTSRITIPAGLAGKYLVQGNIQWDQSTGANTRPMIYKNNAQFTQNRNENSIAVKYENISIVMDLAVADYIELYVWQNSGGTNDITCATSGTYMNACTFQATRIGA